MEAWVDVAFRVSIYGFILLLIAAVVLAVWFLRWLFSRDPLAIFPQESVPESQALRQVNELLDHLQAQGAHIDEAQRAALEQHEEQLLRWENQLRHRWQNDQQKFLRLRQEHEQLWKTMYRVQQNARWWQRLRGVQHLAAFQRALVRFEGTGAALQQERRHLQVIDQMYLSQLRSHAVYHQPVTPSVK